MKKQVKQDALKSVTEPVIEPVIEPAIKKLVIIGLGLIGDPQRAQLPVYVRG